MIKTILCPFCNEEIKVNIQLDGSGNTTVFLIDENKSHSPTLDELRKCGFEFGITEEVNDK